MIPPLLLAVLLALAGQPPAPADSPTGGGSDAHQLFTEANRLFNGARSEHDLRRAVENYRALLARGIRNGRIHYNLGSAHLRLRELGPAVLHLRRALRHLPGDPYAAATLEHARSQAPDEFPGRAERRALEALFFWHTRAPFQARLSVALIAHALFWTLLTAGAFARPPLYRTALGALLVVTLAAGGSTALEAWGRQGEPAVIVAHETIARSGNGEGYDPVFAKPIHGGAEVRLLETRGNWKLAEFPNRVRGWVVGSAVETVAEGEPRS